MPSVVQAETHAGFTQPQSIGELLSVIAQATPDKEALAFEGQRLTYRSLESRAYAVATQLSALGIKRGDRVGLLFPNQPGYVSSFFGGSGLGATIVPVNPLLKSEEIAHILSDSQATAIIVHESSLDELLKGLAGAPSVKHVVVSRTTAGSLPADTRTGAVDIIDLATDAPQITGKWTGAVDPKKDLALLVYTSGTTGKPKGAMLTHENMFSAIGCAQAALNLGSVDRFLAVLPLCHIYGLAVVMLGTIWRGGTLVVVEKFDPAGVLTTIQQEKVTLVPVVPAMYQFMLMELAKNKYDLSTVRVCLSGAAALPTELISCIEAAFGAPLIEGYGMTESSCIATVNPIDGVRKPGSVGVAVENLCVGIFAEDGRQLPSGADNIGEVALKGPNIMQGYYRRPEATQECFRDGWLFTGDLGYKDDEGYLYLAGRKKELILRGGQNIYPREVEEVIVRMPEVAEVAVFGVPDQYMGERVKAVVALVAGASLSDQGVKDFCAERLAEYKVPRLVEFVDRLPRNSTGKVLKRLLS